MDSMDRLRRDLADGPLTRNGFDERLRKRIEERLDERSKARRRWTIWARGAGAGLVLLALLAVAVWQLPSLINTNTAGSTAGSGESAGLNGAALTASEQGLRSALLIGLRQDHEDDGSGRPYSTYRTMLFAPREGVLAKIAEGPGILMPYGMNFWKLEAGGATGTGVTAATASSHVVSAYRADSTARPKQFKTSALEVNEKMLFVGNRYVALEQQTSGKTAGTYLWVKQIDQLGGERAEKLLGTRFEPHTVLTENVSDHGIFQVENDSAETGVRKIDNWTISRKAGRWTLQEGIWQEGAGMKLRDLTDKPGESIVAYDDLTVPWDEIKRVQPAASDAFSSSALDMAAIVTDRNLIVYPYLNTKLQEPSVTEPLQPGEKVIMAQWAQDNYVDIWKTKAQLFLSAK